MSLLFLLLLLVFFVKAIPSVSRKVYFFYVVRSALQFIVCKWHANIQDVVVIVFETKFSLFELSQITSPVITWYTNWDQRDAALVTGVSSFCGQSNLYF